MNRLRNYRIAGIFLALGFFLLAPKILPEMKIHLIIEILIYALWAVAFNLLFGHGGLLAFGFGALRASSEDECRQADHADSKRRFRHCEASSAGRQP